jgi:hypothetical protein
VSPILALDPELSIPVREPDIWNHLTWTKEVVPGSVGWGANFQRSLRRIPDEDAEFLLKLLRKQEQERRPYELSAKDRRAFNRATVRTAAGEVAVEIPDEEDEESGISQEQQPRSEARESHKIQGLIAEIGAKMGFRLWLPRADRDRVKAVQFVDICRRSRVGVKARLSAYEG